MPWQNYQTMACNIPAVVVRRRMACNIPAIVVRRRMAEYLHYPGSKTGKSPEAEQHPGECTRLRFPPAFHPPDHTCLSPDFPGTDFPPCWQENGITEGGSDCGARTAGSAITRQGWIPSPGPPQAVDSAEILLAETSVSPPLRYAGTRAGLFSGRRVNSPGPRAIPWFYSVPGAVAAAGSAPGRSRFLLSNILPNSNIRNTMPEMAKNTVR